LPRGNGRRLAAAAVLALAALVTGCAPGATDTETVTMVAPDLDNPFFREMRAGADGAADAAGVRLQVLDSENDPERQAALLSKAVRRHSDAVLVNPVDPEQAGDAVKPALRADIPVVAVDRTVEGAPVDSTVTSDNHEGGLQAAQAVADALGGTGQVIHIQGDPQASTTQERTEAFTDGLEQYPQLDLATSQPAYFDRAKAREVTAALLRWYPDATAIFAENDQMALGAIDVLGDRAGTEVKVVGYDGIPAALQAVQNGTMAATVAQRPEQMGRAAVEQAVTAIDGGPVAPRIPVGVELVTPQNVGSYL
jgi:ribose transport system substrate-binding protein